MGLRNRCDAAARHCGRRLSSDSTGWMITAFVPIERDDDVIGDGNHGRPMLLDEIGRLQLCNPDPIGIAKQIFRKGPQAPKAERLTLRSRLSAGERHERHPRSHNRFLSSMPAPDFDLSVPYLRSMELRASHPRERRRAASNVCFPHSGIISLVVRLEIGEGIEAATIGRDGVFGRHRRSTAKLRSMMQSYRCRERRP